MFTVSLAWGCLWCTGQAFGDELVCDSNLPGSGVTSVSIKGTTVRFELSNPNFFMLRLKGCKGKTVVFQTPGTKQWVSLRPLYTYEMDFQNPLHLNCGLGASFYLPQETPAAWKHVDKSAWDKKKGFEFQVAFEKDEAIVASRVPYLPEYLESFVLSVRSHGRLEMHRLMYTAGGRSLYLLKTLRPEGEPATRRPTVLMYAREHANEHDGSWVVQGAMEWMLSDDPNAARIAREMNILLMPVMDPDGAAAGAFDRITDSFWPAEKVESPEARKIAEWLKWNWIDAGEEIDLVIDLHSVQSGEGPALFVPRGDPRREKEISGFNKLMQARVAPGDMDTRFHSEGNSPFRLVGYCQDAYGSVPLCYEVNSQSPKKKLTVAEMGGLGKAFLETAEQYFYSMDGMKTRAGVKTHLEKRAEILAAGGNIPGVSNNPGSNPMLIELSAQAPKANHSESRPADGRDTSQPAIK